VDAINNSGRVVGAYTDSTGAQHGFLLSGTTVSSFGTYPAGDAVAVAIGNKNGMVVSDLSAASSTYQSATVVCTGTGC
jgi:probable HAF family extracellular repeat protein